MLIKDACEKSNLTKKAIEYYEAKGLISPEILENGYREYSETDINTLKEISVLRKCGISVVDIKAVLNSNNKSASLAKCRFITEIRVQRLQAIQKRIDNLIDRYDIEKEFAYLQLHDDDLFTIRERLVLAFPGNYGIFLSLHFGRFLNGVIDSSEKRTAYNNIIQYLDHVELFLAPELSEYLETIFTAGEKRNTVQIENKANDAMTQKLDNPEEYLHEHRQEIEDYLAYMESDEYKNSPAAKIKKMMKDFQTQSGYYGNLIENMKILSPAYHHTLLI